MWNCNGSASPACPERRVLPIVTPWAAADEMGHDVLASQVGTHQGRHVGRPRGRACDGSHARRPVCSPSATYRAERYEAQLARVPNDIRFDENEIQQVLAARRRVTDMRRLPTPLTCKEGRVELQAATGIG